MWGGHTTVREMYLMKNTKLIERETQFAKKYLSVDDQIH
jgi:hypothetical protein